MSSCIYTPTISGLILPFSIYIVPSKAISFLMSSILKNSHTIATSRAVSRLYTGSRRTWDRHLQLNFMCVCTAALLAVTGSRQR